MDEVRMFPRWFYKQGEEPRLCASEEEAQALGEGWSDEGPAPSGGPDADVSEEGEEGRESSRRRR
jgi:hypothetical protein